MTFLPYRRRTDMFYAKILCISEIVVVFKLLATKLYLVELLAAFLYDWAHHYCIPGIPFGTWFNDRQ